MSDDYNVKFIKLVEIIKKFIPNFILESKRDFNYSSIDIPLSIDLEDTIEIYLNQIMTTNKDKIIWSRCFNAIYLYAKSDPDLMYYFEVHLGGNSNIGEMVINDDVYKEYLNMEILKIWIAMN